MSFIKPFDGKGAGAPMRLLVFSEWLLGLTISLAICEEKCPRIAAIAVRIPQGKMDDFLTVYGLFFPRVHEGKESEEKPPTR